MGKTKKIFLDKLRSNEIFLADYAEVESGMPIALVYPNKYEVGMSSLGFLTVFKYLIDCGFKPERFFYDIRDGKNNPISIESGAKFNHFSILAFHFSFEPDYINAVKMILDSNINPYRNDYHFKIAGGSSVTANPFPVINFFDAIFIGNLQSSDLSLLKTGRTETLSSQTGWFTDATKTVRQADNEEWESALSFSPVITPESTFKMMNLTEITKGCPVKCKFCMAGNIHGSVKDKSSNIVIDGALKHRDNSNRVGLIGSAPVMHSQIKQMLRTLLNEGMKPSLSSLNVMSMDDELLDLLISGGMKTLTFGIESFNPVLQKSYGKIVKLEKLLNIVNSASKSNIDEIKLYLMLGLPDAPENEEIEIIENAKIIYSQIKTTQPSVRLTLSLNPFIPKASTPFISNNLIDEKLFNEKIYTISRELKAHGIKIKSESARNSYLQYILSLGDDLMSDVIFGRAQGQNLKSMLNNKFFNINDYLSESLNKTESIILRS